MSMKPMTLGEKIKFHSEGWLHFIFASVLLFTALWLVSSAVGGVYQRLIPHSGYENAVLTGQDYDGCWSQQSATATTPIERTKTGTKSGPFIVTLL